MCDLDDEIVVVATARGGQVPNSILCCHPCFLLGAEEKDCNCGGLLLRYCHVNTKKMASSMSGDLSAAGELFCDDDPVIFLGMLEMHLLC